jgi:orotate phosphoribosyltransferase
MPLVERFGAALAAKVQSSASTAIALRHGWLGDRTRGGRQLRCRFDLRREGTARWVLRRGFKIQPGERCLVVEDVVTQGGRALENGAILLEGLQGLVVGVVMVALGRLRIGRFLIPLIRLRVETFVFESDLTAIPAIKPGSK